MSGGGGAALQPGGEQPQPQQRGGPAEAEAQPVPENGKVPQPAKEGAHGDSKAVAAGDVGAGQRKPPAAPEVPLR